ncbi:MAG: hypothetical protein ISS72_10865 [Candidatus Brocadiae bacterium]|nr:hypothetical protein [Candidatus Brocadiia bacterium]
MRKLFRTLLHNLDLKLVAVVLAFFTWHYLSTSGQDQRRFRHIGSHILNLPADVAVLSPAVPDLDVILEGPRGQLDDLEGRELVVEIDLGGVEVKTGEPVKTNVRLLGANIRVAGEAGRSTPLPPMIRFLAAEPAAFTLTLESITERDLPVEPVITGTPAPGYAIQATVQPPTVRVRGPFRLLQNLASIRTEPIPVDGLRERFRQGVLLEHQVATQDGPVAIAPARPAVVVLLEVSEKPEEKTVEHVPIRLAAGPKGLAVIRPEDQPVEATVKLRGPRRLLDEVDARTLAVEASLEDVAPPEDDATKPYSFFFLRKHVRYVAAPDTLLPLPKGIELIEVEPKTVQLILDRLSTRTLPVLPELEGRPAEDHEATAVALPDKIEVTGPQSILRQMTAIHTEPVLVTGLTERLRRPARLVRTADAGSFRNVPIEPAQHFVDVVISVAERRVRKTLNDLPVRLLLTPRPGLALPVEMEPKTIGPVVFEGPRSHIERLTADNVDAFVRLAITTVADLRPTIRNVEFHIADPQVRLAPDAKPIAVKLDFPATEPEPAPRKRPPKPASRPRRPADD